MSSDAMSATLIIDAEPDAVFDVLADPHRHAEIEGTGWVREPLQPEPITGAGQIFQMAMHHPAVGDYQTANLVAVFDRPAAIAWDPGGIGADGAHQRGGWFWRYDLTSVGPNRTEVRLTYDWSATSPQTRAEFGIPAFGTDYLDRSLANLAKIVMSGLSTRQNTSRRYG